MIWVSTEDVIAIHSRIIEITGGMDGVRDYAGLEAAIASPLQSFEGQDLFPEPIDKIARIGYGLAANHAFLDGNKRIGAMVVQLLLKWNEYKILLQNGELADTFIAIADGAIKEKELSDWIRQHFAITLKNNNVNL